MNILVTYYSETGNTRKVAEAIHAAITGDKRLCPLDELTSLDGFDLVFFGFPIMQFGPPRKVRMFLKEHSERKNIAMFVTHAAWETPGQTDALADWLERCKTAAKDANLVGFFHCRGELSEASAAQFLDSPIPEVRWFGSLQPATLGHPDTLELEAARDFTTHVVDNQKPKT